MFSDKSFDSVGFKSQSSTEKSEKSSNIQTDIVVYEESSSQSEEKKSVETQTQTESKKTPEFNYERLAAFLKRVTPGILEALDETYGTNAFEDYNPETTSESFSAVNCLTKLNTWENPDFKTKISGLTWSPGGGSLALGYSVTFHENWCNHLSKIKIYNFTRDNKFPAAPNKVLEVNSCITSILYHPQEPSILAAGLFNGDVLVWNLRDDTSVTPVQVFSHGDFVSHLYWHTKIVTDGSVLVSSSAEGYILLHKLLANFTTVILFKRFKVAKEHNPSESARPRSSGGTRERAIEAGLTITSFDFSSKDPSIFIVGTLCGGVYKCSVEQAVSVEGDESILDPVIDEYNRHEGSVTSIKCSPTKNFFVTSGTDKEIRIYDFDQTVSQKIINLESTIIGLSWCIGNKDIFAAYGATSIVGFFNVNTGSALPNVILQSDTRENTTSLCFNSKRDMVAMGDTRACLEIWKIPRYYS
ncbi:cytoplasmic dynein 2 intermediate chain 2-like [Leptopilina boulardi]|uniref:cytoplasmic dynein 2 intermediate chain 2-like n=1 Tax=Leptopilina boulardi TaxID=63433 RepID=UPI0021F5CA91|nr:cytoplasmic dynein 2 intermediate chain 2-like [Leptopilina boulardi]